MAARKKATVRKKATPKAVAMAMPTMSRRCRDACRDVKAQQICEYLCALQPWIQQVTKCLQNAGLCGPAGGVPANPPNWP